MKLCYCLSSALLTCLLVGAAPALGQVRPESPVAAAQKQVLEAKNNLKKAQADVQKVRDKIKNTLKAKPEWATVTTDATKADADVKNTYRDTMNKVHAKPEFQALVAKREEAEKIRVAAQRATAAGEEKVSNEDLAAANDAYLKASYEMKAMEKKALSDEQGYADALGRVEASKAKLAQLDAEVDEALKADADYQALQQAVSAAQQAVDAAEQQVIAARQASTNRPTPTPRPRSK